MYILFQGGKRLVDTVKIAKWGNSCGIRIPTGILKKVKLDMNDIAYIEADDSGRIIISKKPEPKKGTIEYLFKDYSGDKFQAEMMVPEYPVGNEKW